MTKAAMQRLQRANPVPEPPPVPPVDWLLDRLADEGLRQGPPVEASGPQRGRLSRSFALAPGMLAVSAAVAISAVVLIVALGLRDTTPANHPTDNPHHSVPHSASLPPGYSFAVGGDAKAPGGSLLTKAGQIATQRCMAARGFEYIRLSGADSVETPLPSTFYPDGLSRQALLANRSRFGFGFATSLQGVDTNPNDAVVKSLSPRQQQLWRKAALGPDGCYAQAGKQIFGSRRAATLEQQIPGIIYNRLTTSVYGSATSGRSLSAPLRARLAAWTACMQARTGQLWTSETALIQILGAENHVGQQQSAADNQRSRRLAIDDTLCAYSTGQAQAFQMAFEKALRQIPAADMRELRFLLRHRQQWIRHAARIIRDA